MATSNLTLNCAYCGASFREHRVSGGQRYCSLVCSRRDRCSDDDRFDAKVERRGPSECWPWKGAKFRFGHGNFSLNGKATNAHRFSWVRTHGEIPSGLYVCHHCDNPPCVNPAHLFLGTPKDNSQDREKKGRGIRRIGSRSPKARVDEYKVLEIRRSDLKQIEIAKRFGITQTTVSRIRRRENWGHVRDENCAALKPEPGR